MTADSDETSAATRTIGADGRSDASVVTQFFLVPLAVVAGMVGVFLLFTLATRRSPTAEDYLRSLRSGRFNQRWQAAFELSNILKANNSSKADPRLPDQLVRVFEESMVSRDEDPRVKRYLALALGNSGFAEAVAPLLRAARGNDAETRLYALGGLAHLGVGASEELFREGLTDQDPAIRSVCAYGLGTMAAATGVTELINLLKDPVPAVKWNAALALARQGDDSGKTILIEMLNRKYLDAFPRLEPSEKTELILNAMRGLKHLKTGGLDEAIQQLAENDPDPSVRKAAASWHVADPS